MNRRRWLYASQWLLLVALLVLAGVQSCTVRTSGIEWVPLRDLPPEQAVTAAVAVGACNVEAADTLSGIQPWDATLRRVADGWPRYRMIMQTPGWCFDEDNGLWLHENRGS